MVSGRHWTPAGFAAQKAIARAGRMSLAATVGSAIYVPSVGDQGGCNPIGVPSHTDGGDLVMDVSAPRCGHEGDSSVASGARLGGPEQLPRSEKFPVVSVQYGEK